MIYIRNLPEQLLICDIHCEIRGEPDNRDYKNITQRNEKYNDLGPFVVHVNKRREVSLALTMVNSVTVVFLTGSLGTSAPSVFNM